MIIGHVTVTLVEQTEPNSHHWLSQCQRVGLLKPTELCYKRHRPTMFTLFQEIKLLLIAVSALGLEKVFSLRKITHSCFKCPHTFWDLYIFPFKLLKRQIFIHKALKVSTASNHVHCTCQSGWRWQLYSWMTTLNNTLWVNKRPSVCQCVRGGMFAILMFTFRSNATIKHKAL